MTAKLAPLAAVRHRVKLGVALPFSVRGADGTLLLARGQVIESEEQMQALVDREAVADLSDLAGPSADPRSAPPASLPGLWGAAMDRAGRALKASVHSSFVQQLDEAAVPLLALLARSPDLALFQIVRQETSPNPYGVKHTVHAALTAHLAAVRMGASPDEVRRAFMAAFTMNLSLIELQNQMAQQTRPPFPKQRAAIDAHPIESRELLAANGVTDADWLRAVAEHHELPGGKGYPAKLASVAPLAMLVNRADIFTAKLAMRAARTPLAADRAARDLLLSDKTQPASAAIFKEFGIYPPGTFVRLASGEMGVVIVRGATPNTPLVAALVGKTGQALVDPVRRDTTQAGNAITAVLSESHLKIRLQPEKLAVLTLA